MFFCERQLKYRVRKLNVCRTVAADEGLKKAAVLQVEHHWPSRELMEREMEEDTLDGSCLPHFLLFTQM